MVLREVGGSDIGSPEEAYARGVLDAQRQLRAEMTRRKRKREAGWSLSTAGAVVLAGGIVALAILLNQPSGSSPIEVHQQQTVNSPGAADDASVTVPERLTPVVPPSPSATTDPGARPPAPPEQNSGAPPPPAGEEGGPQRATQPAEPAQQPAATEAETLEATTPEREPAPTPTPTPTTSPTPSPTLERRTPVRDLLCSLLCAAD